ncbi:MAG: prepilin-type N-terminal cleavage/methylation domain-containing protein [Verrucomicrobia bacterium]|nr:MAG: prepilin-type N-terminal cleavage/methylation domain-containing protein [Verrucomicrobiota bacterium]
MQISKRHLFFDGKVRLLCGVTMPWRRERMRGVIGGGIGLAGEHGSTRGRRSVVRRAGDGRISARTGFTLVELLAVLVIMGLLLATVVPATSGLMRSAGVRGATMQVLSSVSLARQTTVTQKKNCYVLFPSNADGTGVNSNVDFRAVAVFAVNNILGRPVGRFVGDWKFFPPGVVFYPVAMQQTANILQTTNTVNQTAAPILNGVANIPCFLMNRHSRTMNNGAITFPPGVNPMNYTMAVNIFEGSVDQGAVWGRPNGATNQVGISSEGQSYCKRLGE